MGPKRILYFRRVNLQAVTWTQSWFLVPYEWKFAFLANILQYSNACTRTFIVCKIGKNIPAVFPRHLSPFPSDLYLHRRSTGFVSGRRLRRRQCDVESYCIELSLRCRPGRTVRAVHASSIAPALPTTTFLRLIWAHSVSTGPLD